MSVLLTGADGYVGWPTALRTASLTDDRVLLVDNFARRDWVESVGSVSAVPVADVETRIEAAESELGLSNLAFVEGDLADRAFVDELLAVHQPDTVVHAAAQPSAPYSQINGERANYTQHNNLQATRNLLWGLHEHHLTDTHFIETTTTGVYGAPEFPIPEGGAAMENRGERDDVPFPAMGGSWYHQTKAFDAANMRLAHTQFDLPVSDVRTAIVYGTETEETATHPDLATRFDFDYYFGTVAHRFCAQAVAGYPVTVYGKGEQRKPFISLEDAAHAFAHATCHPDDWPEPTYNVGANAENYRIREIADVVRNATDADAEVTYLEDEYPGPSYHVNFDRVAGTSFELEWTLADGVADLAGRFVETPEVRS